jgi:exopolysaccharide biosynthesis polyprenyl glycosylphosphotransferase
MNSAQIRSRRVSYLIAVDYLLLVGSFSLAMNLRGLDHPEDLIQPGAIAVIPETAVILAYGMAAVTLFGALGLYLRKTWLSRALHATAIVQGVLMTVLGYILIRSLTKSFFLTPSRLVWIYWSLLLTFGLLIHRLVLFPWLVRLASRSGFRRRVVLVGDTPVGQNFVRQWLAREGDTALELVGLITASEAPALILDIPWLGEVADLPALVETHRLEGAILANPKVSHEELMRLVEECVRLFGWVDVQSEKSKAWEKGPTTDYHFDIPFVRVRSTPRSPMFHTYKRTVDVLGASLGLLVLSPVLLPVFAIVKVTSPGPLFFVRPRIGVGGKPFPFFKIRSMRADAEADPARQAAILEHMKNPDRVSGKIVNPDLVTPIGRFIRKWAIDEIPQLWNVLRGDMSLVGPRPLPPLEYEAQSDWHKRRFDIQPGCTGLWKLYSGSGSTFTDTVLYDLYYARNMSPLMDVNILLRTAWIILVGRADT